MTLLLLVVVLPMHGLVVKASKIILQPEWWLSMSLKNHSILVCFLGKWRKWKRQYKHHVTLGKVVFDHLLLDFLCIYFLSSVAFIACSCSSLELTLNVNICRFALLWFCLF